VPIIKAITHKLAELLLDRKPSQSFLLDDEHKEFPNSVLMFNSTVGLPNSRPYDNIIAGL